MKWNDKEFVPPDGGYGWIIVAAFIFINSCLLPITQCFGIIYQSQFEIMGLTAAKVSFLLHLNNFVMCSMGLISGPLLKNFDYRQVSFVGATLMCFGTLLTAFAQSYEFLICTIGLIIGAGQGVLMPGMYIAVNSYFKERLTLAISFQVTGASLSNIFMPQVCHHLLVHYGVRGTVLILAGIAFNALPISILLRPVKGKKPKRKNDESGSSSEKRTQSIEFKSNDISHVSERLLRPVYQETTYPVEKSKESSFLTKVVAQLDLTLFRDHVYVIIVLGMAISYASELNVFLMMPFILTELSGFDNQNIATAMSVLATADIVGRLAVPMLAHRLKTAPKLMYALSLLGSCLGRTLLAFYFDMYYLVFCMSAVLGVSKGIKAVFQSVVIPKFVQRDKLAAAIGLSMLTNGVISLVVGPLIGWTHDVSNSYIYTLHTASLLSIFCVSLWLAEFLYKLWCGKSGNIDSIDMEENVQSKS